MYLHKDFWYLATVYSLYPGSPEEAYAFACKQYYGLVKGGWAIFCPISHSHGIANLAKKDNLHTHDFFLNNVDGPFINAAKGLIVVMSEHWEKSKGITEEIKRFTEAKKPIIYIKPGEVPNPEDKYY